jgi:hypothetical protein
MNLTLKEFTKYINERSYIPSIYIVRLEYKYVYDDKIQVSNEILQYDPTYMPFEESPDHPWYINFWEWYTDWYMCVDPESVRVINFVDLEGVFDGKET